MAGLTGKPQAHGSKSLQVGSELQVARPLPPVLSGTWPWLSPWALVLRAAPGLADLPSRPGRGQTWDAPIRPPQHPAAVKGTDITLQPITQRPPPRLLGEGSDLVLGSRITRSGGDRAGFAERWLGLRSSSLHHPLSSLARPFPGPGHTDVSPRSCLKWRAGHSVQGTLTHPLSHTHTRRLPRPGALTHPRSHIPSSTLGYRRRLLGTQPRPALATGLLSALAVASAGTCPSAAPTLPQLNTDYRLSSDPSACCQGPPRPDSAFLEDSSTSTVPHAVPSSLLSVLLLKLFPRPVPTRSQHTCLNSANLLPLATIGLRGQHQPRSLHKPAPSTSLTPPPRLTP